MRREETDREFLVRVLDEASKRASNGRFAAEMTAAMLDLFDEGVIFVHPVSGQICLRSAYSTH